MHTWSIPCSYSYTVDVDVMVYVKFVYYIQDNGATALHIASAMGHTEVVDLLISRSATVDYPKQVCT